MSETKQTMKSVAVIGGGLVGSMMACFLAREGFKVHLFEMRPDIRKLEHVPGKSINLALSERGRAALRDLGLEDRVLTNYGIPMHGRLIHDKDGKHRVIPYGNQGQFINSVGRRHLNEILLNEAEKFKNVQIYFDHKLEFCNFDDRLLVFKTLCDNAQVTHKVDTVIGADGAHSIMRRDLMKHTRLDFSQTYIEHGYIELCIPPTDQSDFAMEVNFLHIWPRGSFMMIALPNLDKSYTVTLFMPFEKFSGLDTEAKLIEFFEDNFKDAIPLIGRDKLVEDFFKIRPSSLISVKCRPYNYKDIALLVGDAAHAMVPFYGQGMNCGFEDCLVFKELLIEVGLKGAIEQFTETRQKDCHAICDLAMYNYIEMRDLVNSPWFILRKHFDNFMNCVLGHRWVPLYSMVSFTRTKYSDCIKKRQLQDRCVRLLIVSSLITLVGCKVSHSMSRQNSVLLSMQALSNFARRTLSLF